MADSLGKVIAVASGKGGVGKTTIAVNAAVALAADGAKVGLLDADLYGPDAALMLGITRRERAKHVEVWSPRRRLAPVERYGVKVASPQFLMGEDQAFAAHTAFAGMLVRRLLHGVTWGPLDYLLIDLPPGTADVQQQVAGGKLSGVAVVVTPQDVAHLDARKVVTMLLRQGVRVVGGVENMAAFICPCCGERTPLFHEVAEERSIWSQGIDRLASIPFTGPAANAYVPVVLDNPESPTATALRNLAVELAARTSG